MLHENKSIVKRFLTQVWEEENLDIINEVLSIKLSFVGTHAASMMGNSWTSHQPITVWR
jgi:hypothetical protein